MPCSETLAKRSRAQARSRSTLSCSSDVLLPALDVLDLVALEIEIEAQDRTPAASSVPGHDARERSGSRATRSKSTRSHD
jgi:hypothetical protein